MIQGSMITIGGGLIQSGSADLGTKTITANGTYSASSDGYDGYSEVTVAVDGGSTLVSKSITANGNYDPADDSADGYSAVSVNVPNSYTASDEGKVVSSGALVAQTSRTVAANGTYDTTTNSSVTVNVSGSASVSDVVSALNSGLEGLSIVPFFTSATPPTGYRITYSDQQSSAPAWALFNSTISPVSAGGTINARWTAGSAPQWVQVELPEAQAMNAFYIATVKTTGVGYSFCKTYTIQGSNDGETFDDIYTETLEDDLIGKYVALDSDTSAYLYYRITVTDSYYSSYCGLTSFFPMYIA